MVAKPLTMFPVLRHPDKVPRSPTLRDVAEQVAIEQLLAIAPDGEHREFLRRTLGSPDWNTQTSIVGVACSARAAALLAEINEIREARLRDQQLLESQHDATIYSVDVTLAILPPRRRGAYSVVLVRTHACSTIIGIRRTQLTLDRVAQAFRMLARSRVRHGQWPFADVRLYATHEKAPPASREERQFARPVIDALRGAPPESVPGYGTVPATTITIGPVSAAFADHSVP